jgi:hypothetical protein
MKYLIILSLLLTATSVFAGGPKKLCTLKHADYVTKIASQHSDYDKNRHCSVSCMLSLRCNKTEVLVIGYMKEFSDVFGEGNPERADLVANRYGISLVRHQRARTDKECLQQCDLRY